MSYNVSAWKTKELKDLRLPVDSLFKSEAKDWHPTRINNDDGTVVFEVMDGCEICGTLDGNILAVSSIKAQGEGSGPALRYVFEPALEYSTGTLMVSRVWEGGDSIDLLTCENGSVSTKQVEL